MRNLSYILLIVTFTVALASCGTSKRIKKADKHYELGEYYTAGEIYRSSFGKVSVKNKELRSRVAFNQGECYRLINNPRAEQAYANAIRNNHEDSIVFLRYAQVLQANGKYADAVKNYETYLTYDETNELARNGLYASKMAGEWSKNPTRYKIAKVDDFNPRRTSNYSPAFSSSSGDALVFTSMRTESGKTKKAKKGQGVTGQPLSKIYMTRKNASDKWEKPTLIEGEVNSLHDDGVCSFTADGRTMYFTRAVQNSKTDQGTVIMSSQRAGGAWSEPVQLTIFKDSTISVAHPAISSDGGTLYFVSDGLGTIGGKDIWKAKIEGTEIIYIENLGEQINTTGDEMFPYVKQDGTLYFSSNGRPGLGGLDLFKAVYDEATENWTVENMGVPINSHGDDFGITFSGNTETGFFSTNRPERKGIVPMLYDGIWSFELPELTYVVEGKVVDEQGEPIGNSTVRMVGTDGTNARMQTKKDGTYRLKLENNVDYVMLASSRGYLNQKQELSTHGDTEKSQQYKIEFQLSSIFKPIQIENIFYEFAKWDLTSESETGLQMLIKTLNDNPNITIELSAHTDYVGNNAANAELSLKRAQSVVNYLIKAGIDSRRLTAVGYGEEKPFVVDAVTARKYNYLPEGQELNEIFVLSLSPDHQEVANQINRRTEFRVLSTTFNLY